MTSRRPDVRILGGGLAGLAAALRLAEAGARAEVIETRKNLGGRATSFVDPRTGETLDNCQHVAMGCCTNYLDFCDALGATDLMQWTTCLNFIEAGGRRSTIRPGPLPAPLHVADSFALAPMLTLAEKSAVARAMLAITLADPDAHARETFADWLAEHDQPARVLARFWDPVVVSACNLSLARVAASVALHVFREGFLLGTRAMAVAVSAVPLVRLYDPAEEALRAAGGSLRLGAGVARFGTDYAELSDGTRITAGAVLCALPFERALTAVDEDARDERFQAIAHLEHSPILGVHLEFDRPVLDVPHAVLVERPTQWLFRKDDAGTRVHAVISAADDWVNLREDQIADRVLADIHACLPSSAAAELVRIRSVKEKRATFAATPASEVHRPDAGGSPGRVYLAGDYTRTGWPATMEGAVRSGRLAAAAILGQRTTDALTPPMQPGLLAAALGIAPTTVA